MQKIFLLLLLTSYAFYAQENKSILQLEKEYYSHGTQHTEPVPIPITLQKHNSPNGNNLTKTVFGFLPWWEYAAGSHLNIRYDLLTHIAISFFDSDGDGKITDPSYWPWSKVISDARLNNVKLIMSVSNFNPDQLHKLLTDQTSKQNLFNNIWQKMFSYGFDGVNIDFENLAGGDEGNTLNSFMKSLKDFIKLKKPSAEISFDSPIVKSGIWDFKALADACDYLFIMGYDFYGSWSNTTGPSSPLAGEGYGLTYSLNNFYSLVSPEKLILGVPYYGNYWKTNSEKAYAKVLPYDSSKTVNNWVKPSLRYKEIIPQYAAKKKMWDEVSRTPWLLWGQDTLWNQIWYDDETSLSLKYDLAISKNLKGIGIWALGYDDGRTELWNLIKNKFTPTNIEITQAYYPHNFELHQNYPNPFNPETVISYQLSIAGHVSLKVYDLLGQEVATLVDEVHAAGIYSSTFSTLHSTLSSGIYIYSLNANGFIQSKKMIFLR